MRKRIGGGVDGGGGGGGSKQCREVNEAWMTGLESGSLAGSERGGRLDRATADRPSGPTDGRWEAGAKLSFQGPVKKDPACRPARGAIHALVSSAVQCAVWRGRIAVCKCTCPGYLYVYSTLVN